MGDGDNNAARSSRTVGGRVEEAPQVVPGDGCSAGREQLKGLKQGADFTTSKPK